MNLERHPCALTIAGLDPSAGAGMAADLKTFAALGIYGTCVVTSVTAQNTQGVQSILHLPDEIISSQIKSVCQDIAIRAVKVGMLGEARIVSVVSTLVRELRLPNLVLDPVFSAKDGTGLLGGEGIRRLIKELLPQAKMVTPNLAEASAITGLAIENVSQMREAARAIQVLGPEWVLVKGGHLKDRAIDILFNGDEFLELESFRVPVGPGIHGTGCTLSSAIAAGLAKGRDVENAVREAKIFVTHAIENALAVGSGFPVVNQFGKP